MRDEHSVEMTDKAQGGAERGRTFEIYVPLEKSWEGEGGRLFHHGVASDESWDMQGDQLRQQVLAKSMDYLRQWGKFNLDHRKTDIGDVHECQRISPEEVAEQFSREIVGAGTYVYGDLYPIVDPQIAPPDLLEAHHRLRSGARMGYSLHGMLVRRPTGVITGALAHRVAITPQPVNGNTFAVLCKSFADVYEDVAEGQPQADDDQRVFVVCPEPLEKSTVFDLGRTAARKVESDMVELDEIVLETLVKAVEAGAGVNAEQFRGGRALQPEGLGRRRRVEPLQKGKRLPLGSGQRFRQLRDKLARRGVEDPDALAATIGRNKLGKATFQKLASAGRKRAARRRKAMRKSLGMLSAETVSRELRKLLQPWLSEIVSAAPGDDGPVQEVWIRGIYEDYAIAETGGKCWRVPFAVNGGTVQITGPVTEVIAQWIPVPLSSSGLAGEGERSMR